MPRRQDKIHYHFKSNGLSPLEVIQTLHVFIRLTFLQNQGYSLTESSFPTGVKDKSEYLAPLSVIQGFTLLITFPTYFLIVQILKYIKKSILISLSIVTPFLSFMNF